MKKSLVIMAAGLGSRYGGNKQVDGLGPHNEIMMDYAIYDAIQAGFTKVVFIITKPMYAAFHDQVGKRIAKKVEIAYAFQDYDQIPNWYNIPSERTKPFGTVSALLAAKDVVTEPFCVCNADDYYGNEAFKVMANYLDTIASNNQINPFSMVGYHLKNTISENGTVTRGVCTVNENSELTSCIETYKIKQAEDGSIRDYNFNSAGDILDSDCYVSMNFWGLLPEVFPLLEAYFDSFLHQLKEDDIKSECLLPLAMDEFRKNGKCTIKVLESPSRWFGVTYKDDKPFVEKELLKLHNAGCYPENIIEWYK